MSDAHQNPSPPPPRFCCRQCGLRHGTRVPLVVTLHDGVCDVCGEKAAVSSARQYGVVVSSELRNVKNE